MTKTPGTPKTASQLSWLLIKSPTRGAEACRGEQAFAQAAKIFLAFTGLSILFYWWKPFDFPEKLLPFPTEEYTLWFWCKAMLVQVPLEIAVIGFTVALVEWFREGKFAFKMIVGVGWTAFSLVVNTVAYVQHASAFDKPLFALGAVVSFAPFFPLLRRAKPEHWKPVAAFLLAANAIGILLYLPMAATVLADWVNGYKAAQIGGLLWLLGASTLGVRAASGLKLRSAFMAILFGMCFQISLAFTLHLLGVPGNWLKAAMLYG